MLAIDRLLCPNRNAEHRNVQLLSHAEVQKQYKRYFTFAHASMRKLFQGSFVSCVPAAVQL